MPAAPVIVPLAALKVPVPRPARLMPSLALLVELTASNASVAPVVPVTSTAGPPVALTFVGAGGRDGHGAGVGERERGASRRWSS